MIGIMIECRISHSAHQHGGRRQASLNRVRRQRVFHSGQRRTTNVLVLELKLMTKRIGNRLQNKIRLAQ